MKVNIGDRVELIFMDDKYTNLVPGDKGTVMSIDDLDQLHIKWDNGSTLALIPNIDKYKVISAEILESSRILRFNEMFDMEELKSKHEIETLKGLKIPKINKFEKDTLDTLLSKITYTFTYMSNQYLHRDPIKYPNTLIFYMKNEKWYISFIIQIVGKDMYNCSITYKLLSTPSDSEITSDLVFREDDLIHMKEYHGSSFDEVKQIIKGTYQYLLKEFGFFKNNHGLREN